jgi:hypothetical protein
VRLAGDKIRLLPGFAQSRHQNANQDGNDPYNNQQLHECEPSFRFNIDCSAELGVGCGTRDIACGTALHIIPQSAKNQ